MYVDFIGDKVNNLNAERLITLSGTNIYIPSSVTYFLASFKLIDIRRVQVIYQMSSGSSGLSYISFGQYSI